MNYAAKSPFLCAVVRVTVADTGSSVLTFPKLTAPLFWPGAAIRDMLCNSASHDGQPELLCGNIFWAKCSNAAPLTSFGDGCQNQRRCVPALAARVESLLERAAWANLAPLFRKPLARAVAGCIVFVPLHSIRRFAGYAGFMPARKCPHACFGP